jgi:hypothetical protein
MYSNIFSVLIIISAVSCNDISSQRQPLVITKNDREILKTQFSTVEEIPVPQGYTTKKNDFGSFAGWLQKISLKKDNAVYLFNGALKTNQQAQFAVLNISVGKQDLQQCADAVMRMRAEYLYSRGTYEEISFTDYRGRLYNFSAPYNRNNFMNYLNTVFGMCGTASLSKQLRSKSLIDMVAGDVLIRGGFPGHAVIILQTAQNGQGDKIFMLSQSYMPAQDIHILKNPVDPEISPWYKLDPANRIITPEYIFDKNELKTW